MAQFRVFRWIIWNDIRPFEGVLSSDRSTEPGRDLKNAIPGLKVFGAVLRSYPVMYVSYLASGKERFSFQMFSLLSLDIHSRVTRFHLGVELFLVIPLPCEACISFFRSFQSLSHQSGIMWNWWWNISWLPTAIQVSFKRLPPNLSLTEKNRFC